MLNQLLKQMLKALNKPTLASLLLCAAVSISGCVSTPQAPQGVLVEDPLLPEPQAVPMRSEIAISRMSEILQSAKLDKAQQAQLYYERGVMYDSVGLSVLARIDFIRALRLKPDMADAYNFVGIHHMLNGDYDSAFEAFDSALELNPKYQYAYLNRGIALQYDDKLDLAIQDLIKFQSLQPNDPYRALWRFFAESEKDLSGAKATLLLSKSGLDQQVWATQIVAFYLGEISEDELTAIAAEAADPKQLAEQLCELYFYLGKWHIMQNNPTAAAKSFKLALATNVYEYVEYRHARIELMRLRFSVLEQADDQNEHAH
jgi:lipoprotein NlpI